MTDDKTRACTITLEDGTHYDLNLLSSAKEDYDVDIGNTEQGASYKLNVCRGVVSELWNIDDPDKVGGYIKRESGRGDFSLGEFSTNITLAPVTNEPMLVLQNGSSCPSNEKEFASSAIRFVCSPEDFGAGKPRLVAALPPGDNACHFFFEWKTHVACPTNKRAELESGHLWAFGSFIIVAILTWFCGHTLYNRFYLGRRGADQFPLPRMSLPRVQLPTRGSEDPSTSSSSAPRSRWGWKRRSQRAGYNHLSVEPDEEEALAGARFSLDDDDDDDARVLGGEVNAWRTPQGAPGRGSHEGGADGRPGVGVHQGLVDV